MIQFIFNKIYRLAPNKRYMHLYRDYSPAINACMDRFSIRELKKRLPWYIHPVIMHSKDYYLSDRNYNRLQVLRSLRNLAWFGNIRSDNNTFECLKIKLKMFVFGKNLYSITSKHYGTLKT